MEGVGTLLSSTGRANGTRVNGRMGEQSARDEDASKLNLGIEFSDEKATPLFLAEVAPLLRNKIERDRIEEADMNPVLRKTLVHLERFDQIQSQEVAVDVRRLLESTDPKLHQFEITQLANLLPNDAEEARVVVPSLKDKFEDDTKLGDVIKALNNFVR